MAKVSQNNQLDMLEAVDLYESMRNCTPHTFFNEEFPLNQQLYHFSVAKFM